MLEQYLADLRQSCESRRIPLISKETQTFIISWLNRHQPKRVLEIWSAVWYSSIVISQTISKWWGTLTSFEISYPAYLEALKNIEKANCNNVVLYPFDINEISLEKFFFFFLRNLMQHLLMLRRVNIEITCRKFDHILHQKIRFYLTMSSNIKTN